MSLSLAEDVQKEHPDLYETNVVSTVYQATVYLIAKLRARGHSAYHVAKKAGEGQYTPPGFTPFEMTGTDGVKFICTGVSHDAVWCDGMQFDTVGSGNDSEQKIYSTGREAPDNWSFNPADGPQITARPTWNPVPKQYWRPWNPPLLLDASVTKPEPPKPAVPQYPPYPSNENELDAAGVALFADFGQAGQTPNPHMFRFAFRVCYDWMTKNVPDLPASVAKHRSEWRALLGLPPL